MGIWGQWVEGLGTLGWKFGVVGISGWGLGSLVEDLGGLGGMGALGWGFGDVGT